MRGVLGMALDELWRRRLSLLLLQGAFFKQTGFANSRVLSQLTRGTLD